MKKKPKAAVGDRYDVILTDGGDQKIEVARIVKEITGRHRVGAEPTELFDCPTPMMEGVTNDEAEQIKRRIAKAHGSVRCSSSPRRWCYFGEVFSHCRSSAHSTVSARRW
jgi:ribosomal protein L7/L12